MSRTEADEQKTVIRWCILMEGRWPELEYIYHVPNGGSRNAREAANLKAQGVKPGVPDLELPVARGAYTDLPGAEALAQDPQKDGPLRGGLL